MHPAPIAFVGGGSICTRPNKFGPTKNGVVGRNLFRQTNLTFLCFVNHAVCMQNIKISSKVDEDIWIELKALASETHQNVSSLLTEAIRDYVQRKRVCPEALNHLEDSMTENEKLGKLLTK